MANNSSKFFSANLTMKPTIDLSKFCVYPIWRKFSTIKLLHYIDISSNSFFHSVQLKSPHMQELFRIAYSVAKPSGVAKGRSTGIDYVNRMQINIL